MHCIAKAGKMTTHFREVLFSCSIVKRRQPDKSHMMLREGYGMANIRFQLHMHDSAAVALLHLKQSRPGFLDQFRLRRRMFNRV